MKAKNVALFLVMLLALTALALPSAGIANAAPVAFGGGPATISESGTAKACIDQICPDGLACKCRFNQLPYFKTAPH